MSELPRLRDCGVEEQYFSMLFEIGGLEGGC